MDIGGNEMADAVAKEAATSADQDTNLFKQLPMKSAQNAVIKSVCKAEWTKIWCCTVY